jgi:hypothetical protein
MAGERSRGQLEVPDQVITDTLGSGIQSIPGAALTDARIPGKCFELLLEHAETWLGTPDDPRGAAVRLLAQRLTSMVATVDGGQA